MPEKTAQEVINDSTEKRLTTLEKVSGETLLAVEKQSLIVGLMAKAFMSGAGAVILAVLYAGLNLVLKHSVH